MEKHKVTLTKLDGMLGRIALYEQARAHLIKHKKPVTDFISQSLERMYDEITPFMNYFISKELSK